MLTAMARPVASVATSAVLLPSGTTLKMELGLLLPSATIKYREPAEGAAVRVTGTVNTSNRPFGPRSSNLAVAAPGTSVPVPAFEFDGTICQLKVQLPGGGSPSVCTQV